MNNLFILGGNSFLGSSLHLFLKQYHKEQFNIILLSHNNYQYIKNIKEHDIIINFCGINRSTTEQDYQLANHIFLKKILETLEAEPFIIHVSSLMIYGFKNNSCDKLSNYQKWFIKSKLDGENFLKKNYNNNKLCILRPSNIYGYRCEPYYNNLLSTLVYEKTKGFNKINKINKNCIRNMLSIDNLCEEIYDIIKKKQTGTFNILSNNNISLQELVDIIYKKNIPNFITISNDEDSIPNLDSSEIEGISIIVNENITDKINELEENMKIYLKLKDNISIIKKNVLSQPRGDMIEISSMNSKRLYKITLTQHSIRGNHYHYEQNEEFFINKGHVMFVLAHRDNPNVLFRQILQENELLTVEPLIIHTLINDFINNEPEIIITSTQKYIENKIPDTKYINIV